MSEKTEPVKFDVVVVGGGIVGTSTAWQLKQRFPNKSILLIEKESSLAMHQTGHNSGVVHAGVYYPPGSLKAEFCKRGAKATLEFCKRHDIAYENCGKLLVATNRLELKRMNSLFERCLTNQIDVQLLTSSELQHLEPNVQGLGAMLVKSTSIVDYGKITQKMATEFERIGGQIRLETELVGIEELPERVILSGRSSQGNVTITSHQVVTCSGLMADRVVRMQGIKRRFQIIPYRGEYYRLPKEHNDVVTHLIYPIPDPELPFLGIHLTRMIGGFVTVGPNAVQGWKREGYGRVNFSLRDTFEMLGFVGFWIATFTHLKVALGELKGSIFKAGYLKQVNKYCRAIKRKDLQPHPAGIRAQAVLKDGNLVHDFLFEETPRSLHLCNAPSPAATSAIPIGEYICNKVEIKCQLDK
ncbi:L-2-hydroxyglutarate oxidase [Vibrio sp. ZSDZ34]|uniref:L-2-hydroxyglutarate oxidase n=1 Tax=Vibrio gelatinilyticus TaxID=2893468 RepID=A0A9X1WIU3_9VIBR|nr:L-2-hydroxyglutarate oxidase [Vibrio gelatinilyticus]MCJ2377489.1 L-2-hydroxyglutarate oxidase [Vibrio gelatinilyticus]